MRCAESESGQTEPSSGQRSTEAGHAEELAPQTDPPARLNRGQDGTSSGQKSAPTEPPLELVVDAWPRLPAAIRRGIVAMVFAVVADDAAQSRAVQPTLRVQE